MPRFDGTGPRGQGPLTGRGEGYCAVRLPDEPGQPAYGYAGLQGTPVQMVSPIAWPIFGARWSHPMWPRRAPRRGRGAGRGHRRGRW